MELRPLALFVLACRRDSHAAAARAAGVSPSTLSEAIRQVEAELGLTLFHRGPAGVAPSDAGRWLCLEAEVLLQWADAFAAAEPPPALLRVHSPLRLTFGASSRAAIAAAERFWRTCPGWLADLHFASAYGLPAPSEADVFIGYALDGARPGDVALFPDRWIVVRNHPDDAAPLRERILWLPPLIAAQERQIRAYCAAHDLPAPEMLAEDAAILTRLARHGPPTALLAPHSLVAAGLERAGAAFTPLDPPLESPVVARILAADPPRRDAATAYVRRVAACLDAPPPATAPAPVLSLHNLHAIDALARLCNLTAAARALNVSQPALSAQLRRMEAALGRPLFRRSARGLAPEPWLAARQALLRALIDRAAAITRAARHVAAQYRSEVTLGVSPLVALAPVLAAPLAAALEEWRGLLPGAVLRVREAPAGVLAAELRRGEMGLALVDGPGVDGAGGARGPRDLAALGPLMRLGRAGCEAGPLLLPAADEGLSQALDAHLTPAERRGALRGIAPALGLRLAAAGAGGYVLPQALARALAPAAGLEAVALARGTAMRLRLDVTAERGLGEAERLLAACLRRAFAAAQAASAR